MSQVFRLISVEHHILFEIGVVVFFNIITVWFLLTFNIYKELHLEFHELTERLKGWKIERFLFVLGDVIGHALL